MSPRPLKIRKISNPPPVSGFKPYGNKRNRSKPENVFLHYEEYEAMRLCDYEMLNHHQASVTMNVSRPTLTRIYARARQKIAQALVHGSHIIIEGGKIYFDSEWYACKECGCYFNNPDKQSAIKECPLCRRNKLIDFKQNHSEPEESISNCNDICICPACNFEKPHQPGYPCNDEICPECNQNMVRKGTTHSINL